MESHCIDVLLTLNDIDKTLFAEKVYNTLLLGIFEAICKDIKKYGTKLDEQNIFRNRKDKLVATKTIVDKYTGCKMTDKEYSTLSVLLSAFFSTTGEKRKSFDESVREKLLYQQKNKCAICNSRISLNNAHLDHIIPWDYVGDCLQNNYQMLCETCNTRKGNSTYYELSMLLLNKAKAKEVVR